MTNSRGQSAATDGVNVVKSERPDASNGASVEVPAGAIPAGGSLAISEGAQIATGVTSAYLDLDEDMVPAGPSVNISSDVPVDDAKASTLVLSLPYENASTTLTEIDTTLLIVVYQVQSQDGSLKFGIIINDQLAIDDGFVTFNSVGFGNYQVALVKIPVAAPVSKPADVPILTKEEEKTLPELVWRVPSVSYVGASRSLKVAAAFDGAEITLKDCVIHLDEDQASPWDQREAVGSNLSVELVVAKATAHKTSARFTCVDNFGRTTVSSWSQPLTVPAALKAFAIKSPRGPIRSFTPTISWEAAANDASYRVALATTASGCAGSSLTAETKDTTYSFPGNLTDQQIYYVCVTAGDGFGKELPASNSASANFTVDFQPPSVNVGADKLANATFNRSPTVSGGAVSYSWTQISGSGIVTFGSPGQKDTSIRANANGIYVIRLTVKDAAGNEAYDEMTLDWDATPPTVNVGPDVIANTAYSIDATTSGAVAYLWQKVSGPGTLTFTAGTSEDTTVSASAEGAYTIRLIASDAAGNSDQDTMIFTWDVTPPSPNFSINSGDPDYTKTQTVTLELADDTGVAYYRAANGSDCSAATWTAYAGSPSHTLGSGDGSKTVCLEVKDAAGNASSARTDSITLDTMAPSTFITSSGTFGPTSTAGADTTFAGSANDATSGVNAVKVSLQKAGGSCLNSKMTSFDATCPNYIVATGTTSWTIDIPDAVFTDGKSYVLTSRAYDNAGNVQPTPVSQSVTWDGAAPSASFAISGGASYTGTSSVTIDIADTSGVSEFRVADGTDCSSATWMSYSAPFSFTLAGGEGNKTVCLQVRDMLGNASTTATDSIVLDTTAPSATLDTTGTLGPNSTVGADTTLEGSASDTLSGIASVEVSVRAGGSNCLNASKTAFDAPCPTWHAATGTTSWTFDLADSLLTNGQTYTISTRTKDAVLNNQLVVVGSFTWTTGSLNSAFVINSGDPTHTGNLAVDLYLADDTNVAEYRTANGSDCSAATWTTYGGGGTLPFTLAAPDGVKTVCLEVRDAVFNTHGPSTDSITLDTSEPGVTFGLSFFIGPLTNAGSSTTFDGSASDSGSGIGTVELSFKSDSNGQCLNAFKTAFDATCPVWHAASGFTTWALSINDGLFTDGDYVVRVQATDAVGNVQSALVESTFTWDATPPDPTFAIGEGDPAYASTTSVDLVLADDAGIAEYRAANGSDCSLAAWTTYTGTISHVLLSGDGPATVCLEVRDSALNVTSATDMILLDESPPTSAVTTSGSLGPNSTIGASTDIAGTSSDSSSGVATVEVSIRNGTIELCLNAAMTAFDTACPVWHTATGTTTWTLSVPDALLADTESYGLTSRATDVAGNVESTPTTSSFTWSTGSLNSAFTIGAGDPAYVNATTVTLELADDTNVADYRVANGSDCSAAPWMAYGGGGTISYTLPGGDGAKTVCLEVRDSLLNLSTTSTDSVTLDSGFPTSSFSVSIVVGPSSTAGANTDFTGTAADSGSLDSVKVSIKSDSVSLCLNASGTAFDATCPVWHDASGTTSWTFSVPDTLFSDGSYQISSTSTDLAGNSQSSPSTGNFSWDATPPDPSFYLGAGNPVFTTDTLVDIVLNDDTGVDQIRLALGTDCSAASWISYVTPLSFSIGPSEGVNSVCIEVNDSVGNTAYATDSIALDTTAPLTSISTSGTLDANSTSGSLTSLQGSASDATSGVALVEVSLANSSSGLCLSNSGFDQACPAWQTASGTASWTLSVPDSVFADGVTYDLTVRATDSASNVQAVPQTGSFAWTASPNNAPVLDAVANLSLTVGTAMAAVDVGNDGGDDLDADGDALTYECYFDTIVDGYVSPTSACTAANLANGTGLTFSASTGSLSGWNPATSGTYEFMISGCDPSGACSTVFIEVNIASAALGAFYITAPIAEVATTKPLIKWDASAGAIAYDVVLTSDPSCSTIVLSASDFPGTEFHVATPLAFGTYYACVTAHNADGATRAANNTGVAVKIVPLLCDAGTLETTCEITTVHRVPDGATILGGGSLTIRNGGRLIAGDPEIFYDDFSSGTLPSHYHAHGGSWSSGSGLVGESGSNTGMLEVLTIENQRYSGDMEITAKLKVTGFIGDDEDQPGVCLSNSTFGATPSGRGYCLVFHDKNATPDQVGFVNQGLGDGNHYSFPWSTGVWYWFKLKREGTTLYGKVWSASDPEPASYPYSQSGWNGRVNGYPALAANGSAQVEFDEVGIRALDRPWGSFSINMTWNLNVEAGGIIDGTLASLTATNVFVDGSINGNILQSSIGTLTVNSAGRIDASGMGDLGNDESAGAGNGGGAAATDAAAGGGGGGHAGAGGAGGGQYAGTGGAAHETSAIEPIAMGSAGGGAFNRTGGNGGGMVYISASDQVRVDGKIWASGAMGRTGEEESFNCSGTGGGAGGSIVIKTTAALVGAGDLVAGGGAGGGRAANAGLTCDVGGGGGGGVIYVNAGSNSFTGLKTATGGFAPTGGTNGGSGRVTLIP